MKVEAQGGELVLRNQNGDTIIVPRERRKEAMQALLKDDHRAIDSLALQLPKASNYAQGGTVFSNPDPGNPKEITGPETVITASRPKKSLGNFFRRWGHEHSKDPATSFLGAVGQGLGAIAQLPQAAVTYMLDPKGNVLPSKALQGTQIQKDIEMSAAQGNIGAKILKRPIVQDMLLDPLLLTSEIAKGISKGSELINGLKKSELINDLGNKYLPNAYKLNPWSFKPNFEMGYRMLGQEGFEDAINTGVLRAKPLPNQTTEGISLARNTNRNPNTGKMQGALDRPYFADGFIDERYAADYMAAVNKSDNNLVPIPTHKGIAPSQAGSIPLENSTLYKKDWLKGYKEIPKPKSTLSPISKSWQIQDLPGLHLQSTMSNGPISKIIEPKTGLINTEQALAIIAKESGGNDKVTLIRQGLGENIPKKMDYNEFRQSVQDQLIPLEKQFSTQASNYGLNRLGYEKYKTVINERGNPILQPLKGKNLEPLENQTLILGNKNKFGRGSSAHGNPEETLGHVHFLRDAESPDVLTVTQIQSDAFQGTHRVGAKTKEQAQFSYDRQLEYYNKNKEKLEGITRLPDGNYQFADGQKISKGAYENMFSEIEESVNLSKAELENFSQKQLLDKSHQERYLQELVDYAGKRGDVNKVRVPTSETAAKVQGYSKNTATGMDEMGLPTDLSYSSEHQTILKKYSEQPKTIKKLFGVEPKIVTDSKGNTWYEFDIPKKFKEGKGEIKALSTLGATLGVKQIIDNNKQQ